MTRGRKEDGGREWLVSSHVSDEVVNRRDRPEVEWAIRTTREHSHVLVHVDLLDARYRSLADLKWNESMTELIRSPLSKSAYSHEP